MPSSSPFKDGLWREIAAVLEQAGRHDLVERAERSHRRGRRSNPDIAYRSLARMWKIFRLEHAGQMRPDGDPWTDEQLADKFLRTHKRQIAKLGLKINKRGSLRNKTSLGDRKSDRVKRQRLSRWQIIPSLRPYLVTDPQEAAYIRFMATHGLSLVDFLQNKP